MVYELILGTDLVFLSPCAVGDEVSDLGRHVPSDAATHVMDKVHQVTLQDARTVTDCKMRL